MNRAEKFGLAKLVASMMKLPLQAIFTFLSSDAEEANQWLCNFSQIFSSILSPRNKGEPHHPATDVSEVLQFFKNSSWQWRIRFSSDDCWRGSEKWKENVWRITDNVPSLSVATAREWLIDVLIKSWNWRGKRIWFRKTFSISQRTLSLWRNRRMNQPASIDFHACYWVSTIVPFLLARFLRA